MMPRVSPFFTSKEISLSTQNSCGASALSRSLLTARLINDGMRSRSESCCSPRRKRLKTWFMRKARSLMTASSHTLREAGLEPPEENDATPEKKRRYGGAAREPRPVTPPTQHKAAMHNPTTRRPTGDHQRPTA